MIKINSIKCPLCKCRIYSRARHDFRTCPCGAVSIDGGFDYTKISFDPERVDPPKPEQIEIDATKEELFKDWNSGRDKYGLVEVEIEEKKEDT